MHLLFSCSTVLFLSLSVNAFYNFPYLRYLGTNAPSAGTERTTTVFHASPRFTTASPPFHAATNRNSAQKRQFSEKTTRTTVQTTESRSTPAVHSSVTNEAITTSTARSYESTIGASDHQATELLPASSPFSESTTPAADRSMTTDLTAKTNGPPSTTMSTAEETEAPETEILRFNDSIYRFASDLDSVEGEEFCKRLGGLWNLASIHSQAENDFVIAHLAAEFPGAAAAWLGGFKEGGKMTWVDGKPWNFENWAAGEPEHDGDCLQLLLNANGKWRSENCASNSAAVVCKCTGEHCPSKSKDPLPEKPDEVLQGAFNASDYHLAVDMDSVEGEEYCKRLGGLSNLASIHSAAENQFIAALVKKQHPEAKNAVIGGYRDGDAFAWIDGSSWDFQAWGEGHPASGHADGCAYMTLTGEINGKWLDEFCGEKADVVVCKFTSIDNENKLFNFYF